MKLTSGKAVFLLIALVWFATQQTYAQATGASQYDPIDAGTLYYNNTFSDTQNNDPANGFGNEMGQYSDDIFYRFDISYDGEVNFSHCASAFDTYLHVLDANGNTIWSVDDNGPSCSSLQASATLQLSAGTYYVVSEGYYDNHGDITTQVTLLTPPPSGTIISACGTPERDSVAFQNLPYYANNDYLENFLDSIGYDNNSSSSGNPTTLAYTGFPTRYWIPIKFYAIRDNNGNGGPTDADIRELLLGLNRTYANNNTGIQFYMKCSVENINNSAYLDLSDTEARHLGRTKEDEHGIDVFLTNTLEGAGGSYHYSFFLSFDHFSAVYLSSNAYSRPAGNVFAHEIGHYFGLDHTHQFENKGRCRKEPIDRGRRYADISACNTFGSKIMCESTGDGLRDTPADPNLNDNESCTYVNQGKTDHFGDSYFSPPAGSSQPSTLNIMSYNGLSSCRGQFTRMQVAVMLTNIENSVAFTGLKPLWANTKYIFDTFEPDNSLSSPSSISLGEKQDRNFNYQPSFSSSTTSCDVDWISYFSPVAGNIDITTSQVQGHEVANTILSLLDINGNLLASNDDISGSNTFSQLSYYFNANSTYLIRVENKNNAQNGYYSITVGCDLSGLQISSNANTCSGDGEYSINAQTLPPGAQINWSVSGNLSIIGSTTGNSVNVQNNSSTTGTIYASVNATCSTSQASLSRIVGVPPPSTPDVGGIPVEGFDSNQEYNLWISNYDPNYTYYWELSGVADFLYRDSPDPYNPSLEMGMYGAGYFTIHLTVTDHCGQSTVWELYDHTRDNSGSTTMYMVYPNPADDELRITQGSKDKMKSNKFEATKVEVTRFNIKILDQKGNIHFIGENQINVDHIVIDTRNIPAGTYFLHIRDGKSLIRKQIIINHENTY